LLLLQVRRKEMGILGREVVQVTLGVATAALVGTIYVLVHEKRRKIKALRREEAGGSSPGGQRNAAMVSKEQLIRILEESSAAAYQLIEQTRKMVYAKHEQTKLPLEKVVEELQKDFEQAMETVVFQIRKNHGVTEQQMTAAMVANQQDAAVQTALSTLREAMSGKAPPPASPPSPEAVKRTTRRSKNKQRKG